MPTVQTTNTSLKTLDHSRYGDAGILTTPYFNSTEGTACIKDNTLNLPLPKNTLNRGAQYFVTLNFRLNAKVYDGAISIGDATFTSATAGFTGADEGKTITVVGAGTAGADLETTILTYTSATEVELTDAAATTVTNAVTTFEVPTWDNSLELGFWDNTAGQRKYLEGTPIALTGETVGTPAGTISREYKMIATTDWGETLASETITVADAPDDDSFTNRIYVSLAWTRVQGVSVYDIYRNTGGTYHWIRSVYPNNSYFDKGTYLTTALAYPTADRERPRAFIRTNAANFVPTGTWQSVILTVPVPASYDTSKTTDKQWLRIGLQEALVGAGLFLEVDKISVDAISGYFTRCPLDLLAKRAISATPTESQGTIGGGSGGAGCPVFDQLVECEIDGVQGEFKAITLYRAFRDDRNRVRILSRNGILIPISGMSLKAFSVIYETETEDGSRMRTSDTQPVFDDLADSKGKPLKNLKLGVKIQTKTGMSEIVRLERQTKRETVVRIALAGEEKGYWLGGIACHNLKDPEEGDPTPEFI